MGSGQEDPALVHRALQSISQRTSSHLAAILVQEVGQGSASSSHANAAPDKKTTRKKGIDTIASIFASELGRAQTRYLDEVDQRDDSPLTSPSDNANNSDNGSISYLASNLRAIFGILAKLASRADSGLLRQVLTSAGGSAANIASASTSSSQPFEQDDKRDAILSVIVGLACATRWLMLCESAAAAVGSSGLRNGEEWSVKAIRKVVGMLLDEDTCISLLHFSPQSSRSTSAAHGGRKDFRVLSAVLLVLPTSSLRQAKHRAQLEGLARQLSQSYSGAALGAASSSSVGSGSSESESGKIDCLDAAALLFSRLPALKEQLMSKNAAGAPAAQRMLQDLESQQRDQSAGRLLDEKSSTLLNDLRAARKMHAPKGKSLQVTEDVLDQVHSILPHYTQNTLQHELSHGRYAGKSVEEIVQILLDHGLASDNASPVMPNSTLQPTQRANIFDDASLFSATRLDKGKGKGKGKARQEDDLEGLSGEMKRLIIARSNAPRSDDEDEEEDPMNPFAALGGGGSRRGAEEAEEEDEEEGDEEPTGIWRRQRLSNLGGPRANARDWRQRLEDWEESESSASEAEGEGGIGGAAKGSSSNKPAAALSGAEAERAAERILIRFYADFGGKTFEKTQESRKGRERKQLKDALSRVEVQGRAAWDDHMIESWGTLFQRNPRKEKLLSASRDILNSGGNPNLVPGEQVNPAQSQGSRFGSDRGRGGRIIGEGRGGGSGPRPSQSGGRGGGPSRGRGGGGGQSSSRGGASSGSGSNQTHTQRQKERRGNQARQRGADRKAQRGFVEGGA